MNADDIELRRIHVRGFAIGTMFVSVATLALGDVVGITRDPTYVYEFGTALFASLAGLACGGVWWRKKADPLPMPVRRALLLAIAVSLSILACAVIVALGFDVKRVGLAKVIDWPLGIVLSLIVVVVTIFVKFAAILVTLMVGWTFLWRFVVNPRTRAETGTSP